MATSPHWKIYTRERQYIACCDILDDALTLAGKHGPGTTLRWRHGRILWTEGVDGRCKSGAEEAHQLIQRRKADWRQY